MDIALLGADQQSILLAVAAVELGHQFVWSGDIAWASENYDLPWLTQHDQQDHWEALLDAELCDVVIVGTGTLPAEQRQEQLAALLRNGISVLTTFPLMPSVLSYYEIDMVRNETGALLRHFTPLTEPQPVFSRCQDWVTNGHEKIGRIEQVQWERSLEDRSREQVLWHFAQDVSLLERFAGRLDRLGAHGAEHESTNWSALSVQLVGKQQLPVQWMARPAGVEGTRLSLIGERGEIVVKFDEESRPVELIKNFSDSADSEPLQASDPSASAIERLESSLRQGGSESSWDVALHCMELADTIEISLRRGRMIDIHNQQLTEDLAFRGTMSAVGCGLIMILPPLLLFLGWFADLVGLPIGEFWPHVLLALLALFLTIQFLPRLLSPSPSNSNSIDTR